MQEYLSKDLDALWATDKAERARYATLHTRAMAQYTSKWIDFSVKNSKIYSPDTKFKPLIESNPAISVIDTDTVSALFDYTVQNEAVCLLNFASYSHAGGGFMNGARAQEEALCYASNLYNVLSLNPDYYAWNSQNKNKGLGTDRALYTPNIMFFRGSETRAANVITCAAPKKQLCIRYHSFTEEENTRALMSRVLFLRRIVEDNPCDVLILGAWGCGVFKQNPAEVARLFKVAFTTVPVKRVIYAIPSGINYTTFKKVILDGR